MLDAFRFQNANRLLGSYDGAIGVKNGYTSDAGYTLAAAAVRDDVRLVVTVLNADDGRAEPLAAELLDWGFDAVGAAEPVGELVTPEEVAKAAAATEAAEQAPTATNTEAEAMESATSSRAGRGIAVGLDTRTTIVAGGTAALSALLMLLLFRRRRRRSRRPTGRYAA